MRLLFACSDKIQPGVAIDCRDDDSNPVDCPVKYKGFCLGVSLSKSADPCDHKLSPVLSWLLVCQAFDNFTTLPTKS